MAQIDEHRQVKVTESSETLQQRLLDTLEARQGGDPPSSEDELFDRELRERGVDVAFEDYFDAVGAVAEVVLTWNPLTTSDVGQIFALIGHDLHVAGNLWLVAAGSAHWSFDLLSFEPSLREHLMQYGDRYGEPAFAQLEWENPDDFEPVVPGFEWAGDFPAIGVPTRRLQSRS